MTEKLKKILTFKKKPAVGLFIDNANWFYPQKELGWRISYEHLKKFLSSYFDLSLMAVYAGTPLDDADKIKFDAFCQFLRKQGLKIKTKPLKKIWIDRKLGKFEHKCNFDVEIALDVAREVSKLDLIMVGSGDSDFLEISRFAIENKKKFWILCFERGVSWEMRKLPHIFFEDIKAEVAQKKPRQRRGVNN